MTAKPPAEMFGRVAHFGSPHGRDYLRHGLTFWRRAPLPVATVTVPRAPPCTCKQPFCQQRRES